MIQYYIWEMRWEVKKVIDQKLKEKISRVREKKKLRK